MSTATAIRRAESVMGTVVSYLVDPAGCPEDETARAMSESVAELHRLAGLLSTWDARSPMSRFRRGELDSGDLPSEIGEVLELCSQVKKLSQGWFDPWAIEGGVDPTGLAKGWVIERATAVLAEAGVGAALLNGGGDMATLGSPATDGDGWRVGVQHPWRRDALACVVKLPAGSAMATSGRYERGEHLVDPFAGQAAGQAAERARAGVRVASATVTGPSLAIADGLATALAVAGDAFDMLGGLVHGYEAYRIYEDGSEEATPRFPLVSAELRPPDDGHG